jgi:hypothetical protein
MKYGLLVGGAIFALIIIVVLGLFFGYMGFSNNANKFEADIPAQYSQMQNVYDNGWKQVMEENQIPQNYAAQVKDVFQGTMTGRYGPEGSKALFQMITEQNPQLDPSLYKKVQESIERFHAEFQGAVADHCAQAVLPDLCVCYDQRAYLQHDRQLPAHQVRRPSRVAGRLPDRHVR